MLFSKQVDVNTKLVKDMTKIMSSNLLSIGLCPYFTLGQSYFQIFYFTSPLPQRQGSGDNWFFLNVNVL
jgi:hypothetical protein